MKAAVFKAPGKPLSIENIDDPKCGENEMILKVQQCGICGTDLHASDGGSMEPETGTIFGHEFSGEIVEIGKNLKTLQDLNELRKLAQSSMETTNGKNYRMKATEAQQPYRYSLLV